jgi:hypothetical protein
MKPNKKRREYEQISDPFGMICYDMYKRFGGAFGNLKALCKTEAEKQLLTDQLMLLRTEVRRLLEEARNT